MKEILKKSNYKAILHSKRANNIEMNHFSKRNCDERDSEEIELQSDSAF